MSEFFTGMDVADMYLYYGCLDGTDGVLQGDGGMGISTGIEDDAIDIEAYLMELVDQGTLAIGLVISYFHIGITLLQHLQVVVERLIAIDAWFALA